MRCRKGNGFISVLKPLSIALLLFMVFGIVWLRSSVVSLEYSLSNLEKKKSGIMKENKTLAAEQANLLYVGRLQNVASNGAGLEFPDRVRVVYVNTSGKPNVYTASLTVGNNGQQ
jgi:hypothetical protein